MNKEDNMLKFSLFLSEEIETNKEPQSKKVAHLTHLEDLPIYHGHQGVKHASDHLEDVHDMLMGKKVKSKISTKYDGAPSIVFGRHPTTKQFFVASKSAFNKTPKINYTLEDIERNHGHAPGLVEKLKAALEHLPKIAPPHGVYQGDLMYTKGDVEDRDGQYHFTPNTITYSTNKNSSDGQKVKKAKLGIVVHTRYDGNSLEDMQASPETEHEHFKDHPDVHLINPKVKIDDNTIYTPEMQREFRNHMENAKQTYASMHHSAPDVLAGHEELMEQHVNDMVRKDGKPSTEGYMNHLQNKIEKDVASVKTEAAKERKRQQWSKLIKHVHDNREHFDKAFQLHSHLQKAKNVLIKALDSSGDIHTSINGERTGHEGYVVNRNNVMSKLVNRENFSKMNALMGGIKQKKAEQKNANIS